MASFVFPSIAKRASRKLFDQLTLSPSRPLLFHVLSGNGVYFYAHLMRQCAPDPADDATLAQRKREMLARIAGCIVDSAPPRFDRDTFTRGFVGAMLDFSKARFRKPRASSPHTSSLPTPSSPNSLTASSSAFHKVDTVPISALPKYSHPILTPITNTFFSALLAMPNLHRTFESAQTALLRTQPANVPQLFLYSKADELIPWYDVEYFIKLFSENGFNVQKHCFQDSPHVSHLLFYPEQYIALVQNFVKSTLFK